jgi:hypothetical protein
MSGKNSFRLDALDFLLDFRHCLELGINIFLQRLDHSFVVYGLNLFAIFLIDI